MGAAATVDMPALVILAALAGAVSSVTVICTGLACFWKWIRSRIKTEEIILKVPAVETALASHTAADDARFDGVEHILNEINRKLDVVQNDISWLKKNGGGR